MGTHVGFLCRLCLRPIEAEDESYVVAQRWSRQRGSGKRLQVYHEGCWQEIQRAVRVAVGVG